MSLNSPSSPPPPMLPHPHLALQNHPHLLHWESPSVTIHDTRSGNQSCDASGDLSPIFSMFVYVCLCLFTCVWSLDLFWKLYIVPMLRELTSLSFNIDYDILITCLLSEVDLVTGGPAHKLSPSLPLGSHVQTMGELVMTMTPHQPSENSQ